MLTSLKVARLLVHQQGDYGLRLARTDEEVAAAQALRFAVFNLELNEGLETSYQTGRDADPFDAVCHHLLVEHLETKQIVGTYRLQMGTTAAKNLGYYSEQEFDFSPYEANRAQIVELGRACVHKNHRNLAVLGLLWKGIADYAREFGGRYLIGCSSLTSQDPAEGASMYTQIVRSHLAPTEWRTMPKPAYDCPMDQLAAEAPKIPKLLRAYLTIGAKICGPPALDRQFKTIDFLTLLDIETLQGDVKRRFLS
ncbi:MAG: hemolysin [Verrucomicrobia bacterium]|jgi:putative hemolysin|nr:hemolysin [Verrucomicrobiota bacterium]